jgi:cytochrome c peroxidase
VSHRAFAAIVLIGAGVLAASLLGCGAAVDDAFCDESTCVFSADEWRWLQTLSPIPPVPADASNRFRAQPQAASLGGAFFSDARFSGPATQLDALGRPSAPSRAPQGQPTGVRCATCHDLSRGGIDVTSAPNNVSEGAGWTDVNAPSTVGSAYNHLWFLNGRADSSWSLAVAVAESVTTMNGNRLKTAWTIADHYRADYDAVFGPAGDPLPLAGTSADLAALLDGATGRCSPPVAGACAVGCQLVTSTCGMTSCLPRFPLQGKPGAQAGCQAACGTGEPFDDAYDCMTGDDQTAVTRVLVNWAKALDAYQATLVPAEAPFDRMIAEGPKSDAVSPAAKRGARLFVGKGACIDCHTGGLLSDGDFHNVGVPQEGPFVPTLADCPEGNAPCDCVAGVKCLPWGAWDGLGRLATSKFVRTSVWSDSADDDDPVRIAARARPRTASPSDPLKGAWRTPSLRNVALTSPYMHDGAYTTLEEVVRHYGEATTQGAVGIPAVELKPILLTAGEEADLVEFLRSLTGASPSALALTSPEGH